MFDAGLKRDRLRNIFREEKGLDRKSGTSFLSPQLRNFSGPRLCLTGLQVRESRFRGQRVLAEFLEHKSGGAFCA
jgi:hypothetical protein